MGGYQCSNVYQPCSIDLWPLSNNPRKKIDHKIVKLAA